MSWFALTILSAFFGALARIMQKTLLKDDQSDPFAFSFVFQMIVAGMFLLYTLVTRSFELPNLYQSGLALNLVLVAVLYSLGNLLVFYAFKYAQASEVSVIMTSATVWSVATAMFFLGERLSPLKLIGVALIVAGIVVINVSATAWKVNKGHGLALLSAFMFGAAFTNDAYLIAQYQSIPSFMVLAFTLPALLTLAYRPSAVKHLNYFANPAIFKKLVLCCAVYALSAFTIFTAYKLGGQASLISPIQQISIIFTMILSYVILQEKDQVWKKIIGTALAFGGVVMMVG